MGFIRRFRERYRGREFWRGANRGIGVILYTILLVGMMAFPMYLGWLILGYVVVIPSYGFLFVNHLREMEKQRRGDEVLGGWVEHEHGLGEPFHFDVEDIQPYEKLSKHDITKVDEMVDLLVEQAKVQKKIAVGEKPKESVKQIPFKVPTIEEFEKLNGNERKKYADGWLKLTDQLKEGKEPIRMDDIKKLVDKIEDEQENEEDLRELYEKDTGKKVEWQGKTTKGYLEWKKERLGECEDG